MNKNTSGQKLSVYAYSATTGLPKTGDAANITAYVSKDDGSVTQLGDTSATEQSSSNAPGYYLFDLTQAETNADKLMFSAKSSTSNIVVLAVPSVVYTVPASFSGFVTPTGAAVNVTQFGGSNGTFASGRPEVNTSHIAGSAVSTSSAQIGVNVVNAGGTAWATVLTNLVTSIWAAVTDSSGVTTLLSRLSATRAGYLDNLSAGAVATASALSSVASDVTTLVGRITSSLFSGITSLAQWLGLLAGKQTGNSTARTELRATGAGSGTFDETTDSQEAIRDRGDAAWTTADVSALATASALSTVGGNVSAVKTVTDALPDSGALTSLATASALATVDGKVDAIKVVTDELDTTLETDGGSGFQFTVTALENAPGGGGGGGDWTATEKEQIRYRLGMDGTTDTPSATPDLATASAVATVDMVVDSIKTVTDALPDAGALTSLAQASALSTVAGNVSAVKAKTDNLPSDPADESLIIAATDALSALIGTPAGASVSADVAAVKSDTAAIKAKTDNLPSDPADESLVIAAINSAAAGVIAQIPSPEDNADATITASTTTPIQSNLKRVNDVVLTGNGSTIPWGPA